MSSEMREIAREMRMQALDGQTQDWRPNMVALAERIEALAGIGGSVLEEMRSVSPHQDVYGDVVLAWADRLERALLARTEAGADGVCRQLVRDDHSFCAAAQEAREHIEKTFAEKCAAGEFDAPEYHDTARLDWLGEHLAGDISLRTIAGASYITADSPYELRYSIDEARREFGAEPTIVRDVLAEWRLKAAKYDLLCEQAKFHGFNNACEAIGALTHPQDASGDVEDARRYRWARDHVGGTAWNDDNFATVTIGVTVPKPRGTCAFDVTAEMLDAAIDAAMQAKEAK